MIVKALLTAHKALVDSYLTDLLADLEDQYVNRSITLEERILAEELPEVYDD